MMMRIKWLFLLLAVGIGLFGLYQGIASLLTPPPINVLLVTLDTTRSDRLGCYGYQAAQTPTLDDLAARGVLFERAATAVPMTLPSHVTLLTGLQPPEHGLHYNGQNSLGREIPTLAELLKLKGYQTAAFIGAVVLQAKYGLARGFQVYDDDIRESRQTSDSLHSMRPGRIVVDSALAWLKEQKKDDPFFCWVHLYDPHHPYEAHEELFGEQFKDRPYDGEMAYVDRQVERLVAYLKQRGLDDRTLVIVAGDHGESLGEHGEATHAFMLYEATMRVPLIVSAPRWISGGGTRVSQPVSLVDVFPTILDCLDLPAKRAGSGRSLKPALQGKPLEARACYGETEQPFGEFHFAPLTSVVFEQWKYIRTRRVELYDILADPAELHNLASDQPDRVKEMENLLAELEQNMSRGTAPQTNLSPEEQRALESLGYGAGHAKPEDTKSYVNLPDIKDMIGPVTEYNAAQSLMDENKYEEAGAILLALTTKAPDMFMVHHNLGACLASQGQNDKALASFQRALELHDNSRTRLELGKMYILTSQFEEAIPHLQAASRQAPDTPFPHFYWGEALRHLGKSEQAREQYNHALKIKPRFKPARQALVELQRAPDAFSP